jgi:DNA polymerase III delta subunit
MKRAAPPVHFTRERHVSDALRAWTPTRMVHAMEQLAEASLEMRRNAPLAESIAQRMLLSLTATARKAA